MQKCQLGNFTKNLLMKILAQVFLKRKMNQDRHQDSLSQREGASPDQHC